MGDIEEETQVLLPYCEKWNLMSWMNFTPDRGKKLEVNAYKSYRSKHLRIKSALKS